jgi:hypothetical protein
MALAGAALQRSHLVLTRAGCYHAPMLFQPPHEELSDADIVAVLCEAMAGAGRLPRASARSTWSTGSALRACGLFARCNGRCIANAPTGLAAGS